MSEEKTMRKIKGVKVEVTKDDDGKAVITLPDVIENGSAKSLHTGFPVEHWDDDEIARFLAIMGVL